MKTRSAKFIGVAMMAVVCLTAMSGCKTTHLPKMHVPKLHWPWVKKPAPIEPQANQIIWEGIDGAAATEFPQSWARNTLVIDMTGAFSNGAVRMHAKASMGWPVRIALRVRPGNIASVEVQADQRVIMPLVAGSAVSIDLPLAPGVYSAKTETITISWSATLPVATPPAMTVPPAMPAAPAPTPPAPDATP